MSYLFTSALPSSITSRASDKPTGSTSSTSSSSTPQIPYSYFHLFPQLPLELRQLIWTHALETRIPSWLPQGKRVLAISRDGEYPIDVQQRRQRENERWGGGPNARNPFAPHWISSAVQIDRNDGAIPAIAHVCHESRHVATALQGPGSGMRILKAAFGRDDQSDVGNDDDEKKRNNDSDDDDDDESLTGDTSEHRNQKAKEKLDQVGGPFGLILKSARSDVKLSNVYAGAWLDTARDTLLFRDMWGAFPWDMYRRDLKNLTAGTRSVTLQASAEGERSPRRGTGISVWGGGGGGAAADVGQSSWRSRLLSRDFHRTLSWILHGDDEDFPQLREINVVVMENIEVTLTREEIEARLGGKVLEEEDFQGQVVVDADEYLDYHAEVLQEGAQHRCGRSGDGGSEEVPAWRRMWCLMTGPHGPRSFKHCVDSLLWATAQRENANSDDADGENDDYSWESYREAMLKIWLYLQKQRRPQPRDEEGRPVAEDEWQRAEWEKRLWERRPVMRRVVLISLYPYYM